MPRAKNQNGRKAAAEAEWGGFIDVRLSAADKEHFQQWLPTFDMNMVDDLLADDLKLSLTFDAETDTYLCSLTTEKHAGPGLRCVLPARAGIWERAIALAVFKHVEMLGADWGRYRPSSGRVSEV